MSTVYNFCKVSDLLACSGQPREGELPPLAAEGYRVVINLGLADARYALKDEEGSVKSLGLAYHHLPILFEDPKTEELFEFISIMDQHRLDKTLVHCAANYRASVFTGMYLFAAGKLDESNMRTFIEDVWQPDAVWDQFIEESLGLLRSH